MKLPRLGYSASYYGSKQHPQSAPPPSHWRGGGGAGAAGHHHYAGHLLARFYSTWATPHSLARQAWAHHAARATHAKAKAKARARAARRAMRWGYQPRPLLRVRRAVGPAKRRLARSLRSSAAAAAFLPSIILVEQGMVGKGGLGFSFLSRYRRGTGKHNKSLVRKQTTLVVAPAVAQPTKSKGEEGEGDDGTQQQQQQQQQAPLVRTAKGRKLVRAQQAVAAALARSRNRTLKRGRKRPDEFCLFFNRFGRCAKGEAGCPFLHDPEKVAVCRAFLKGACRGKGDLDGGRGSSCLLSHKVEQEKMPTCAFFLKGACTKDDCPYSHVKVNAKARACPDFLKGWCPRGAACTLKHTHERGGGGGGGGGGGKEGEVGGAQGVGGGKAKKRLRVVTEEERGEGGMHGGGASAAVALAPARTHEEEEQHEARFDGQLDLLLGASVRGWGGSWWWWWWW